jgi:hypothetical protein
MGILFSSFNDDPIFIPLSYKNVNAIAPPIMISSTLSRRFRIKGILSATLAPPSTTIKRLC